MKTFKRCKASISVHAKHGATYFLCSTDLSSNRQLDLSGNGYIDFVVPQMPLSGGTYHLAVCLEFNGEILDWVDNAVQMVVINGDFYETGTGRVTPVGWEGVGVLVKHHWRQRQTSTLCFALLKIPVRTTSVRYVGRNAFGNCEVFLEVNRKALETSCQGRGGGMRISDSNTNPFVRLRKKLGRIRRALEKKAHEFRLFMVDSKDPLFWWETWIRYGSRQPIWFTDKYGVTLRLYPYDALRHIRARRSHFDDEGVLRVVQEFLKPGMTVVDIGSNIGQFALFSAALVGDSGKVHSFEPASDTFKKLEENIHHAAGLSGRIRANCLAVGKESGEAVLYKYPPGCSVWNSLNPHTMYGGDQAFNPCGTEKVHVVSLDEYCHEQKVEHIDLLKVDVEGFEADVFRGSMRLIREKRIRQAIFEISLANFKDGTVTAASVLNTIRNLGFDIRLISTNGALVPTDSGRFIFPYFANYFAIPAAAIEAEQAEQP